MNSIIKFMSKNTTQYEFSHNEKVIKKEIIFLCPQKSQLSQLVPKTEKN